jgi:YVTN family beta-propeller protein
MSFRVVRLVAALLPILFWVACGQVYRPVVIPCSEGGIPGCPNEPPAIPSNFHAVFGISTNVPNYPGGAMQIDVAGDTIIGETPTSEPQEPNLGVNPTHLAILPNHATVFVPSAGSVQAGGVDIVSSFGPATQSSTATGLGAVTTIPLPTGSLPVYMDTVENGFVYVANYGTNSVSQINTTTNAVVNTATVGVNPVALAEAAIPGGDKIYVANQGSNTVSSLNSIDLSLNAVTGFTGVTPVWVLARSDGQKVYVLTEGDGQLVTIDTATDTVAGSLPVGAGANFIFYDSNLNRLYVTNPVTQTVYVFSDIGGANDTPTQVAAISFAANSASCPKGCVPASVTALPDGSRFYVASYQLFSTSFSPPEPCPDTLFVKGGLDCVVPGLTVFNANNFSLQYPAAPTLTLLTDPPFAANPTASQYQFAVPRVTACGPAAPPVSTTLYSPTVTRFRVFTVASADSSRVYVSMCDAGAVAVVNTTGSNINNPQGGTPADVVVTDLLAAFSGPTQSSGEPPPQNPIFLLTGQ